MAALLLLLTLALYTKLSFLYAASSELVLEQGYTVSTVADFNKPSGSGGGGGGGGGVHPYAVLPRPRSEDFILLDSSASTFYSFSIPLSKDSEPEIKHLSGNSALGFVDGDPSSALFNRPRSFAIDAVDNVYVPDRINHVIRKIDKSGYTTTIAGGYSRKPGNTDGPAQNASFSSDFELIYVSKLCALLVVDRGNSLIRQIGLKPRDCVHDSHSGLGMAWVSVIAILGVLVGSILGFIVRPFLTSHEVSTNRYVKKTPRRAHNPERMVLTNLSAVRNAIADSSAYAFSYKLAKLGRSYLYILLRNFSFRGERKAECKETSSVSLMDLDMVSNIGFNQSGTVNLPEELKDLICLDSGIGYSLHENELRDGDLQGSGNKIDEMIRTNLLDFSCENNKEQGLTKESELLGASLVRRRHREFEGL